MENIIPLPLSDRVPLDDARRYVLLWRQSGLTRRQFCERHNIPLAKLRNWTLTRMAQADLIQQAEDAVSLTEHHDIATAVAQHDNELTQKMETLFKETLLEREHMLSQEKPLYQQVLRLARQYSHAFWAPGTEIAHPLDKPVSEWPFVSLSALPEPLSEEKIPSLFKLIFTPSQEPLHAGF